MLLAAFRVERRVRVRRRAARQHGGQQRVEAFQREERHFNVSCAARALGDVREELAPNGFHLVTYENQVLYKCISAHTDSTVEKCTVTSQWFSTCGTRVICDTLTKKL